MVEINMPGLIEVNRSVAFSAKAIIIHAGIPESAVIKK
jgi:hypothetical protein